MKEKKTLYTFALVALLTLSAYFLADTVDAVIGKSLDAAPHAVSPLERGGPRIEPKRELSDYTSILERGLFGEGKGPSGGTTAAEATAFRLIGTVEGETFSGAVLEDPQGVQTFYRRDQKLPDGFQIVKVMRDRITLKKPAGGVMELQIIDDARIVSVSKPTAAAPVGGVRKVSEGRFMVDQQAVAESTENLNQILTQARALPYMEHGKTVGFRITEIVPGSIYERIGLQNGDVIQKINATDVDDPAKFFQMYQGLKEEKSISLDVMRGGQRQTLNYEIR
jgi:general secretion pathway protein C